MSNSVIKDILNIISYLTKLGEKSEKKKIDYFDRYVDPTYKLAENVYRNFRAILLELKRMIEHEDKNEPILKFLEEKRLEFLPARLKLRAIIRQRLLEERLTRLEKGIWSLMSGSVGSMENHIETYPLKIERKVVWGAGHTIVDLVDRIAESGETEIGSKRTYLLQRVEEQTRAIDNAWEEAAAGYAEFQSIILPEIKINSNKELSADAKKTPG